MSFGIATDRELHPLIRNTSNVILKQWNNLIPDAQPLDIGEEFSHIVRDDVTIENYVWESERFRKIHLEIAHMSIGLDIMHANMYPRYEYDIPIFGADIVANPKGVGAAIIDISPLGQSLPKDYDMLQMFYTPFTENRAVPEWGDVFSDYCVFCRPDEIEYNQFVAITESYLSTHIKLSEYRQPLEENIQKNYRHHLYYCTQQRKNDKTRNILHKLFGEEFGERYLTEMLFDCPLV